MQPGFGGGFGRPVVEKEVIVEQPGFFGFGGREVIEKEVIVGGQPGFNQPFGFGGGVVDINLNVRNNGGCGGGGCGGGCNGNNNNGFF